VLARAILYSYRDSVYQSVCPSWVRHVPMTIRDQVR